MSTGDDDADESLSESGIVLTRKVGGEVHLASGDILTLVAIRGRRAVLQLGKDAPFGLEVNESAEVPGGTVLVVDVMSSEKVRLCFQPEPIVVRPPADSDQPSEPSVPPLAKFASGLCVLGFVLTLAALAFWMFAPVYSGSSQSVSAGTNCSVVDGTLTEDSSSDCTISEEEETSSTLLEANRTRVLLILAVPVVLAGLAVFIRRRFARLVAGILLLGLSILGGFTIGLSYLPSAILILVGGGLTSRRT